MKTKLIQNIKEKYGTFTWWYSDEKSTEVEIPPELWTEVEKAISQSKEELMEEIKKKIPDMVLFRFDTGSDESLLVRADLEELLEDLNKK